MRHTIHETAIAARPAIPAPIPTPACCATVHPLDGEAAVVEVFDGVGVGSVNVAGLVVVLQLEEESTASVVLTGASDVWLLELIVVLVAELSKRGTKEVGIFALVDEALDAVSVACEILK